MKLLLNKSISHNHWLERAKQIESNYKSVVKCGFNNQMSSAGDWSGYLLQKSGNVFYAVPVFRTNLYPATDRMDIWRWFDDKCPNGLVKDIIENEKNKPTLIMNMVNIEIHF